MFCRHQRNTSPFRVGNRNPPPPKVRSRADQRFQTLVGFGNGMVKERHACGIGGYRAKVLDYPRRSGLDGIREFAAAVVTVYPLA